MFLASQKYFVFLCISSLTIISKLRKKKNTTYIVILIQESRQEDNMCYFLCHPRPLLCWVSTLDKTTTLNRQKQSSVCTWCRFFFYLVQVINPSQSFLLSLRELTRAGRTHSGERPAKLVNLTIQKHRDCAGH